MMIRYVQQPMSNLCETVDATRISNVHFHRCCYRSEVSIHRPSQTVALLCPSIFARGFVVQVGGTVRHIYIIVINISTNL